MATRSTAVIIKHDAFHVVVRKRLNRRRLSVPSSPLAIIYSKKYICIHSH